MYISKANCNDNFNDAALSVVLIQKEFGSNY